MIPQLHAESNYYTQLSYVCRLADNIDQNLIATATVEGVHVEEVLDGYTVRVSWEPVVLEHWEVHHYTIYYTTFSTSLNKTVHQHTLQTPNTKTFATFHLNHIDPKFEHWFEVTVSIEVEGEEFESQRSSRLTFKFGVWI